ncbi:MAG: site-specific integrase, partial [Firmicutes bacterium]|nr:site-specific integrase [Bacillota bacterium]
MAKKRADGEGNIRKRADGRWEGRYTAGYHPETGKHIIKNVLGKTQAECKAKLKKAIEESQSLDVGRADEYTVAAWLRTWFELYAKPHIRPSTMNYYHRNIEQHVAPAIGDIPLNKLTTRDLQKLYNDLQNNGRLRKVQKKEKPGLSNSTVRGIHMMLHNALDQAVKEKLILSNPTENCIIPKIEKQEMKILHPDHISAYLNAAERRNALPMFYLELVSGLRKGELVALQWSDLDEANCTISVSKQASWDTEHQLILSRPKTGNSIREVSIPQDAVELLKQEHAKHPDNPWMFP